VKTLDKTRKELGIV